MVPSLNSAGVKTPKLRFLLRAVFSCALIALLLSRLDGSEVRHLVRGVRLLPLLAGTTLVVCSECLMAERTRLILDHWGVSLSRRRACAVTWIGQFSNNFLPGGMGGDMVKFYRVSRLYPHAKPATLVALIADRLVALAALVVLSTLALSLGDRQMLRRLVSGTAFNSGQTHWPAWWVATLLGFGSATCLALACWRYRRAIVKKGAVHLQSLRAAFRQGGRLDRQVAAAFVLAVAVHGLGILAACSFARALAIPLTVAQMCLVWPVVAVAAMMPVSVNGHGLREFILLYYFGRWHLASHLLPGAGAKETVVALSLLMVVNDLICNLPGGFFLLASTTTGQPAFRAAPSPVAAASS